MSQVLGAVGHLSEVESTEQINEIFAPGKTWSDSTGLIYNVETP